MEYLSEVSSSVVCIAWRPASWPPSFWTQGPRQSAPCERVACESRQRHVDTVPLGQWRPHSLLMLDCSHHDWAESKQKFYASTVDLKCFIVITDTRSVWGESAHLDFLLACLTRPLNDSLCYSTVEPSSFTEMARLQCLSKYREGHAGRGGLVEGEMYRISSRSSLSRRRSRPHVRACEVELFGKVFPSGAGLLSLTCSTHSRTSRLSSEMIRSGGDGRHSLSDPSYPQTSCPSSSSCR